MNRENKINESQEALAKYSRVHIYSHFLEISEEHQGRHQVFNKEADIEYDKSCEWQSEKYYQLRADAQKSGYIAIVFSAMYIESAVYDFGAIYLGDNYVLKHVDKLNITSKIIVLLKLATGRDLNTDGQAYEHLKKLFEYRNELVHSKSKPLMSAKEMHIFREKTSRKYYEAINSAKKIIEFLDKETREINEDEYHPGIFGHK